MSAAMEHSYPKLSLAMDRESRCSSTDGSSSVAHEEYFPEKCNPHYASDSATYFQPLTGQNNSFYNHSPASGSHIGTKFQQHSQQQQPQNMPETTGSRPATELSSMDLEDLPSLFSPLSAFLNDVDFEENMVDIQELEEYLVAPSDATTMNTFELLMNEQTEDQGSARVPDTDSVVRFFGIPDL
ncbi:unnamed protein product [Gongylonema pulchrum]|uniref:TORC_C domain-containing protein n=1 Tax=Gongylonema pulchrum TaxID=637853 RepID=A0A183E7Q3_9BILA|nr:unnamed protein product [Gongylonema pulchrum]